MTQPEQTGSTPEERVADFNEWLHGISEYRLGPLERKHLAADFRNAEQAGRDVAYADAEAVCKNFACRYGLNLFCEAEDVFRARRGDGPDPLKAARRAALISAAEAFPIMAMVIDRTAVTNWLRAKAKEKGE